MSGNRKYALTPVLEAEAERQPSALNTGNSSLASHRSTDNANTYSNIRIRSRGMKIAKRTRSRWYTENTAGTILDGPKTIKIKQHSET